MAMTNEAQTEVANLAFWQNIHMCRYFKSVDLLPDNVDEKLLKPTDLIFGQWLAIQIPPQTKRGILQRCMLR